MTRRVGMEVSVAIGEMVKMADADVIAAYPITPQTHIVEHLAELVANGELDAEYIPVESEHSAMSACLGSAAVGARTFTASAGQGLELMHEVLYVASSMRLPIVMSVANRALSGPLSVWGDHSDVMSCRDVGWIQIFTENGQEVIDQIICAFRIAEDPSVLLPVMVHLDGFHLSHVIEPMLFPEEEEVASFLPDNKYPLPLHPSKPVAMGDFAPPVIYTEAKWAQEMNLRDSYSRVVEIWHEFNRHFGRQYNPVETYKAEGAQTLLLTMGSFSETAMTAIDKLQSEGESIGLVRLRLWRPFPFDELKLAVGKAKTLVVLDRALSAGGPGGPVASEIKAALFNEPVKPAVISFIAGLGGRDITQSDFIEIIHKGQDLARTGKDMPFQIYGVRG